MPTLSLGLRRTWCKCCTPVRHSRPRQDELKKVRETVGSSSPALGSGTEEKVRWGSPEKFTLTDPCMLYSILMN
jgi:hypothetical protein